MVSCRERCIGLVICPKLSHSNDKFTSGKDYATGEIAFIVLSFTSKSLLAWITVGGVFYDNT